jgi:hypothetical protein
MIVFFLFGIGFVGLIAFAMIRISITSMFWLSKKPNDKNYVFKRYFPYYIIVYFGLCVTAIIQCDIEPFSIYFFGSLYVLALLIWAFKMRHCKRIYSTPQKNEEPESPNLP